MLQKILKFSLNHSFLVLFGAVMVIIGAIISLPKIPVDVFPELNPPRVLVMTEASGYSAEEIEQYISFPIESAVNGLPGVTNVRSASSDSLSLIWVEFGWGEDIYRARQLVSERLSTAREILPKDVSPEIAPITSVTGEIMLISLMMENNDAGLENITPMRLREIAEFDLRNKILSLAGVAQVVAIGGDLPEYQILINIDELRKYDLTVNDLAEAVGKSHSTDSAGFLPNVNSLEISIRQNARVKSAEDIAKTVLKTDGKTIITIGDVAEVKLGAALMRGTASDNNRDAVVLSIQKSPEVNTLALTDKLEKLLSDYKKLLPAGISLNTNVFKQSDFINAAVSNVVFTLRDAAILVAIILILFLMNIRTTIITLTALPLSLAISFLVLWAIGLNINVMTLGGLTVAIGELVDDAIIYVENCFRRLKENALLPQIEQKTFLRVVYDSSNEVRNSVVFATIIITVVFIPLICLQGLEGRFFRPLGLAYVISILASLLVALTVTPAMCKYLLKGKLSKENQKEETDSFVVRQLKRLYLPCLKFALRFKVWILAISFLAIVISCIVASSFGTSFLPKFREGTFTVFVMLPPGSSLESSNRLAKGLEKRFMQVPGVRHVVRRSGRAERDEHAELVSTSEIELSILDGHNQDDVRKEVNTIILSIPGLVAIIGQPIEHRLSMTISGTKSDIAVNFFGENLATLRAAAAEAVKEISKIKGSVDVSANREVTVESIAVNYRPDELKIFGLTRKEVAEQLSLAFNGKTVTTVNDGIKLYELVLRLPDENRTNIDDVRNFLISTSDGKRIRLNEVADVIPERVTSIINRDNLQRKAVVNCGVGEGANLGHLVAEVEKTVQPISIKYGLTYSLGGQFEAQQSSVKTLLFTTAIVLIIIFLLLLTATQSAKIAALVMINLPLTVIGGVFAVFIAESPNAWENILAFVNLADFTYTAPVLSVATIVGYITLFGLAIRNGLLLVNNYSTNIKSGMDIKSAIIDGSLVRLVPIMMTALVTILGLLPILFAGDKAGAELIAPIAIVQLGGLTTATILNLFVIPAGFLLMFKNSKKETFVEKEIIE